MAKFTKWIGILVATFVALAWIEPAQAQATRTWVSGVGDDANPCSRTAPCKTWAGAISKTAAGGEIDALDPGGFGGVTITKAITLDGGGGQVASILVAGTNGITVAAGSSDIVTIRNIRIQGIKQTGSGGLTGISYTGGATLDVVNCNIDNFTQFAINIAPPAGNVFRFEIDNTVMTGNGTGTTGGGVGIQPTGNGIVVGSMTGDRADNNANGLFMSGAGGSGGGSNVTVVDSTFDSNAAAGVEGLSGVGQSPTKILLQHIDASNNVNGLLASGSTGNSTMWVGGSTIAGNSTGFAFSGSAVINSYGDNLLVGNTTDGTPTATISKK